MSDKKQSGPRIGIRPFTDVLQDLAGGDVDKELTAQLAELTRACEATKKKGKLVITLNVSPGPKMMGVGVDIKVTIPKTPLESTQFYTADNGGLHMENPRQSKLPFDGPRSIPSNDPEN
jgi:hypothetical protein